MVTSSIRIALIGYGHWGKNYARIINELPDTQFAAICELDSARIARARERHPQVQTSTDASEMVKNTGFDAAIISTPASTHYELARIFLESGRHVLLEKPMALQVEHCEQLCDVAARTGRVLMVGHTFLYNPGIRKMKEVVQAPDFGRVYYLHATRTNLGPIRHDVNAVWDLGPHDVSIFSYLLGEHPKWASAVGSKVLNNGHEDVAFITLGYPGGVIANIHVSWADPNKVRNVVAVGSRRRVVFDDLNSLERLRIFEKGVSVEEPAAETYGEFKLLVRDGDILSPRLDNSEPLKDQCEDFIAAVTTRREPVADAHLGTEVVRALVAAEASMRDRGEAKEVCGGTVCAGSLR